MSSSNLLYLTHRVPHPPNRGDRIRTYHILRFLSCRANVFLGCLADEPVTRRTEAELTGLCEDVAVVPVNCRRWLHGVRSVLRGRTATEGSFWSAELAKVITEWAQTTDFSAALASSSALAQYLQLPELHGVPAFVDLIDVDSQKWADYASASLPPLAWLYRLEGRRLRRLEKKLATSVQGLAVVSEPEARLFQSFCPGYAIQTISNGVDLDYFRPTERRRSKERGCVFVGALDYKPNVDGVCWFCREVWPGLRQTNPHITLQLVGRQPARDVCQLAQIEGVEIVGTVPDVRPYLDRAAVVVVPLQIARGVQNKLLEALAMGKAVVSSPKPIVGLGVEPGIHVRVADTPARWIEAITQLLEDGSQRSELGLAGLAYVTANHSWERCLQPLSDFFTFTEQKQTQSTLRDVPLRPLLPPVQESKQTAFRR